jgi:hypothetical protein
MQIEADITRIENELLSISDTEDLTIRTALYRNLIVLRLLLWIGSGGFSSSGFYGGVAKFIDVTTPNGSLVRLLVAVYPTNEFLLNVMQQNPPNNIQGRIRNVVVNGVAV